MSVLGITIKWVYVNVLLLQVKDKRVLPLFAKKDSIFTESRMCVFYVMIWFTVICDLFFVR